MILDLFINYSGLAILLIGLNLSIIGVLFSKRDLAVIGIVTIASSANSPGFSAFIQELIGVGISIPILLINAGLSFAIIHFSLGMYPKVLFSAKGVMLFLLIPVIALSLVNSISTIDTFKALICFTIIVVNGWLIFGRLANSYSNPRQLTCLIAGVMGVLALITTVLLIGIAGPTAYSGLEGGAHNKIRIFSATVTRLQTTGYNATGVGATAAIAFFWSFSLFSKRRLFKKTYMALVYMMIALIALLWSGSRGAIFAFMLTIIALFSISGGWELFSMRKLIIGIIIASLLIFVVVPVFYENVDRNATQKEENISFIKLFIDERINLESAKGLEYINDPTLFGRGYNVLSLGGINDDKTKLESYWLKAWIELGVVGSILHVLTFIVLSLVVIRADLRASRHSHKWEFLPSAIMIFVWANSITSWGFILPYGQTMIYIALISSSLVALQRVAIPSMQKQKLKWRK